MTQENKYELIKLVPMLLFIAFLFFIKDNEFISSSIKLLLTVFFMFISLGIVYFLYKRKAIKASKTKLIGLTTFCIVIAFLYLYR